MTSDLPVHQVAKVTFRHTGHSSRLEALCHEQAQRLFEVSRRLATCHIIIEAQPHRIPHDVPDVQVILHVAGEDIAVRQVPDADTANAEALVRKAFAAARRQLLDEAGRRRDRHREPHP